MTTKIRRIAESLTVLQALGMPKEQLNDLYLIHDNHRYHGRHSRAGGNPDNYQKPPAVGRHLYTALSAARILCDKLDSRLPPAFARMTGNDKLFGSARCLHYVTAFPDRGETFRKFLAVVAWETEVWCASDPTHLIHFNGIRFLGPYISDKQ